MTASGNSFRQPESARRSTVRGRRPARSHRVSFARAIGDVPVLADRLIAVRRAGWKVTEGPGGEVWAESPLTRYLVFDPAARQVAPASAQELGARIDAAIAAAQRAERVGEPWRGARPAEPRRWSAPPDRPRASTSPGPASQSGWVSAEDALTTIRTQGSPGPFSVFRAKLQIEAKGGSFVVTAPSGRYVLADPAQVLQIRAAATRFRLAGPFNLKTLADLKLLTGPLRRQYLRIVEYDKSLMPPSQGSPPSELVVGVQALAVLELVAGNESTVERTPVRLSLSKGRFAAVKLRQAQPERGAVPWRVLFRNSAEKDALSHAKPREKTNMRRVNSTRQTGHPFATSSCLGDRSRGGSFGSSSGASAFFAQASRA